jgi:hypothetical protein
VAGASGTSGVTRWSGTGRSRPAASTPSASLTCTKPSSVPSSPRTG